MGESDRERNRRREYQRERNRRQRAGVTERGRGIIDQAFDEITTELGKLDKVGTQLPSDLFDIVLMALDLYLQMWPVLSPKERKEASDVVLAFMSQARALNYRQAERRRTTAGNSIQYPAGTMPQIDNLLFTPVTPHQASMGLMPPTTGGTHMRVIGERPPRWDGRGEAPPPLPIEMTPEQLAMPRARPPLALKPKIRINSQDV